MITLYRGESTFLSYNCGMREKMSRVTLPCTWSSLTVVRSVLLMYCNGLSVIVAFQGFEWNKKCFSGYIQSISHSHFSFLLKILQLNVYIFQYFFQYIYMIYTYISNVYWKTKGKNVTHGSPQFPTISRLWRFTKHFGMFTKHTKIQVFLWELLKDSLSNKINYINFE